MEILQGNWWGVNNPYADDMSCFPNIKKLFLSKEPDDVFWINLYWKNINLNNNVELLDQLEQMAKERLDNK